MRRLKSLVFTVTYGVIILVGLLGSQLQGEADDCIYKLENSQNCMGTGGDCTSAPCTNLTAGGCTKVYEYPGSDVKIATTGGGEKAGPDGMKFCKNEFSCQFADFQDSRCIAGTCSGSDPDEYGGETCGACLTLATPIPRDANSAKLLGCPM